MSNETVREVCAEIQLQTYQTMFRTSDVIGWRDRILAAYERELAAIVRNLDALEVAVEENCDKATVEKIITSKRHSQNSIAAKDAEIARLKAALLTICTADKTAEGLREIAIDACNGKENYND